MVQQKCLNHFLGHSKKLMNPCYGCTEDYDESHHPNNMDCDWYIPVKVITFEVKEMRTIPRHLNMQPYDRTQRHKVQEEMNNEAISFNQRHEGIIKYCQVCEEKKLFDYIGTMEYNLEMYKCVDCTTTQSEFK